MANETKTGTDKSPEKTPAEAVKTAPPPTNPAPEGGIVSTKLADNPKVIAPEGTVPTAMQAGGPTPPHPSSDEPDLSNDTDEVKDARARIAEEQQNARDGVSTDDDEVDTDPVQCVVKKDFVDPRGALHKAGETYFWTRQILPNGKQVVFPYPVLEPVSKPRATALKKEYYDREENQDANLRERNQRTEMLKDALRVTSVE